MRKGRRLIREGSPTDFSPLHCTAENLTMCSNSLDHICNTKSWIKMMRNGGNSLLPKNDFRVVWFALINPRTYTGEVGRYYTPPVRFFFSFFERVFCQHLPFLVAVSLFLSLFLGWVWGKSVAIATLIWRHKHHEVKSSLNKNACFSPFFMNKMPTKAANWLI